MAEYIEGSGKRPIDALCDLLIEEDLQTSYVRDHNNPVTIPPVPQSPRVHGRDRWPPAGGLSQSTHLRQLPAHSRHTGTTGRHPNSSRRHSQDDLRPCKPPGPEGPWRPQGREQARHRRLRPCYYQVARYLSRPQTIPRGHRLRRRERDSGGRPRPPYRRPARPGPAPRSRLAPEAIVPSGTS